MQELSITTAYWGSHPELHKDLQKVRGIIVSVLRTQDAGVSGAVEDLLCSDGKMLRPAFVLLAARVAGGGRLRPRIYKIAAAIEIIHSATLVHDDVIDGSMTRRGRPSINARYGNGRAVLFGDYLFSRCFTLLADFATLKSSRRLAQGITTICAGELAQSNRFDPATLSTRNYLRRIAGKTAALFSLSCMVGAMENGGDEALQEVFRRLGYAAGMSFQITDDLLDLEGDTEVVGKPLGADLREGIYTLPVILSLKAAAGGEGAGRLLEDLSREQLASAAGYRRVIEAVRRYGGLEGARAAAGAYTARALRYADRLPESPYRDLLISVVRRLLLREA